MHNAECQNGRALALHSAFVILHSRDLSTKSREQPERILPIDGLQIAWAEHAAILEALHMLGGVAEREVGAEHNLRDWYDFAQRRHGRRVRRLGGVVVELVG